MYTVGCDVTSHAKRSIPTSPKCVLPYLLTSRERGKEGGEGMPIEAAIGKVMKGTNLSYTFKSIKYVYIET